MSPKTIQPDKQFFTRMYRPFLIVMHICGFNFRLPKTLLARIVYNFYTIFLMVAVSFCLMTCCPNQEISVIWSLLEYLTFVMVMMFYRTKIYGYFQRLITLDGYLRINQSVYHKLRKRMYFFVTFVWLLGACYAISSCVLKACYASLPKFVVYELCLLALDINRVWRYAIFEAVWRRLRFLKVRLEENPENSFYLYVKDNRMVKDIKIKLFMCLYKEIADLLDLMSPELNASLLAGIVCSLPKLIVNVYRVLLVIDQSMPIESLGFMLMHIFQTSLFIFSPCVVIEMYGAEVDSIRQFLIHRLMVEKDPRTREDLQLFLEYTSIRPFQYKIWRMIPMDVSLPLQIINLCTTYVIVIVNFTKVFDN